MDDWRDFNGDGEIDGAEEMFAEEMLCEDREEHIALFGNDDGFEEDTDDYDDGYDDVSMDGDYDDDRYEDDSDYADGVDDALDELGDFGDDF